MRNTILSFAAFALVVGLWGSQPAAAEEDRGVVTTISGKGTYSYRLFQYPSKVANFFMYPQSYVTFDTANGKYWDIESTRVEYWNDFKRSGYSDVFGWTDPRNALRPEALTVSFYTPDMRLLGVKDRVRIGRRYSIPRDGNNYDRIIVKIESEAKENFDIKMRVWDPVDPVTAEPMPTQIYHR